MFKLEHLADQDMVGKYLCKLNKQKLEELNEEMTTKHFKKDIKATHAWSNIKDIATNTNPLFNNIYNFFKKR